MFASVGSYSFLLDEVGLGVVLPDDVLDVPADARGPPRGSRPATSHGETSLDDHDVEDASEEGPPPFPVADGRPVYSRPRVGPPDRSPPPFPGCTF